MSIREAAQELKGEAQARLGDKFSAITGDMDLARKSGSLDHALQVGQLAPQFTLPDAFGNEVSLRHYWREGLLSSASTVGSGAHLLSRAT